ncbi:MAG: hypothetical protein WCB53_11460 [Terriglobales bacterium]
MKSVNPRALCAVAALFAASGILFAQTPKSYSQLNAEHPGWMQIPGRLIRPDCVHEVPSGAQIELDRDNKPTGDVIMNGQVIAHYDSCPEESVETRHIGSQGEQDPGTGNGWVEASQWELSLGASDNIDDLYGYWHVPSPPAESGALIYLFNGLEPSSENSIMQPVLQYGDNGAFGGEYYSFASWLVGPKGSGIAFYSTPYVVSTNDYLLGISQQNGVTDNTLSYFVNSHDTNTGQSSVLNITTQGLHWVWAFAGVLEAYNVTSCSQFPPNDVSHFYKTGIAHGYPAFEFKKTQDFYGAEYSYGGPSCKFSVSVSGTTSALNY